MGLFHLQLFDSSIVLDHLGVVRYGTDNSAEGSHDYVSVSTIVRFLNGAASSYPHMDSSAGKGQWLRPFL